jgi:hypothetical protein
MAAKTGRWAGSLARAGAALVLLGGALDAANAAEPGSSCCQDLESRVAELEATAARKGQRNDKAELKITGVVHRALFYWDDGVERNLYSVDSAKDSTTFAIEGDAEIVPGWKAGFSLNVNTNFSISETTNQLTAFGDGGVIDAGDMIVFITSEKWGTVQIGVQSSASDGIDNINLADADVAADFAVQDWNGSFFLRARNGALLIPLAWDNFFPIPAGTTGGLVTYTSPVIMGFELSASVGADDFKDVALRYQGEWAGAFEIRAGIGVFEDTSEPPDFIAPLSGPVVENREPVEDAGWGGSIAVKHKPTGLNLAVDYSTHSFTDRCFEPGHVSGECRGDDELLYIVGGIVRKWFPLGDTAIYGEYFRGTSRQNQSDPEVMSLLSRDAFNPDNPRELKGSVVTEWGFGIVQKVDDDPEPSGKKHSATAPAHKVGGKWGAGKDAAMEAYVGYRHMELDVDLIGRNDAGTVVNAPSKKLNDFDLIATGLVIRF